MVAAQPRSLHVGVIHAGRIIQEIETRDAVKVGTSQAATLVLPPSARLSKTTTLFSHEGGKFSLHFDGNTEGLLTVDATEVPLAFLREKGVAKKHGGHYVLPLVSSAQGSLELGDVVVAFDFVEPLPQVPTQPLPLAVRSGLVGGFDTVLTIALASSSLLFGLLLLYLSQIPVPEEITFDQIDDRFAEMIMPQRNKPEVKVDDSQTPVVKDEKAEKKPDRKAEPDEAPKEMNARRREVQARIANKGLLGIFNSKTKGKGAIADVFSEGRASNDIDSAFSGIGGVIASNAPGGGVSRGTGSQGSSSSIGNLATSGAGKVGLAEKAEAKVGEVKISDTPEVDGSLDQADIARVVRGRLTALKECYERELKRNPQLAGKVVVRFTIDEEGRVSQAVIEENTLPDRSVATCVAQRVERFRFPKPDGGSVTVSYPFIFAPSS
jgi:TonB family protein